MDDRLQDGKVGTSMVFSLVYHTGTSSHSCVGDTRLLLAAREGESALPRDKAVQQHSRNARSCRARNLRNFHIRGTDPLGALIDISALVFTC